MSCFTGILFATAWMRWGGGGTRLPRKHSGLSNYYCNCLHTPPITEMNNKLSSLTGSFLSVVASAQHCYLLVHKMNCRQTAAGPSVIFITHQNRSTPRDGCCLHPRGGGGVTEVRLQWNWWAELKGEANCIFIETVHWRWRWTERETERKRESTSIKDCSFKISIHL